MDWSNERYVRLYTRDTDDWLCLSWDAKSLWMAILRKLDRAGVLETKRGPRGVAALTGAPLDVVERALPELLADGCLAEHPLGYLSPNYIEANESHQTEAHRAREYRARQREMRRIGADPGSARAVTKSDAPVTKPDATVTNRDATVTASRDAVTPCLPCLPCLSDLHTPDQRSETGVGGAGAAWAAYSEAYATRYGRPATATAEAESRLAELVTQHGEAEVVARARRMLLSPPAWLKGPCDVGTLFRNFDKLVGDRAPPRPRPEPAAPVVDEHQRREAAAIADAWLNPQPALDLGPDPDPVAELRRMAREVAEGHALEPDERAGALSAHERLRDELDIATAHLDEQESA